MFVQIIKGKASDPAKFRKQTERWRDEVRPGAVGFLGGTGGVADDGTILLIGRFADEASAQANSTRPEQSAWWEETATCFVGEPTFRESSDVALLLEGGSDDAGFVQMMEGAINDRAKAEALETPQMVEQLKAARPDVIGAMRAWFDGGAFAMVTYFTNEEEARKGEASQEFQEPQPELKEYDTVFGEMTFTDIRNPILIS